MMTAIYPGSFDPFTNGHFNVLRHASNIFDKVYVVVMKHPNKKRLIDVQTSEQLIRKSIPDYYDNVEVVSAESDLIYKEAKRLHCDYIVRGVRNNGLDYSYEENLAEFNKDIGNINTIFIRADVNKNVSSTMIKTLLANNESISAYVPGAINKYLKENYR
jgi:pantetheine-phosphate adenylyltransferase